MARLQNRIVMGYFPTPPTVIEQVSHWITPPADEQWRLLDPCCGNGEAQQLAALVGGACQTWGVELSPGRAEEAARVMDRVYNAAWQQTRVDRESVSLLWLNPPYDHDLDGADNRLEIEFLRTAAPTLMVGGVLVYIVPQHLLGHKAVALRLAGHFEGLVVRRFPDGEFEQFKQVIVLGRKKRYKMPEGRRVEALRRLADVDLPPLSGEPAIHWPLELPSAPEDARFRRVSIPKREQIARAHSVGWPEALRSAMRFKEQLPFQPAITPKKGHVAMLMASGLLGNMRVKKNGREMLIKGRVFVEAKRREETDENERKTVVTTYQPKTTVGVVDAEGIQVIGDVAPLTTFMEEYGDVLAEQVLKNPPLYDPSDPPALEWEALSRLGTDRKPLPGQKRAGLLDTQKHAAITMMRAIQKHSSGLLQGEMGVGKTTVSLAIIDLLGAYPAIILCPPHLVSKWRREAKEVIPGVQTRELARIGRTGSMKRDENDVRRFIEDWKAGRLGEKAVAVVSSTAAKLGSGWKGAPATRYTLPAKKERRAAFCAALKVYQQERERLRFVASPEKLQQFLDQQRNEIGYLKHRREEIVEAQRQKTQAARRAALDVAIAYPVCPICGQRQMGGPSFKIFDKRPLVCDRPVQGWVRDKDGDRVLDDEGNPVWYWTPEDVESEENAPRCGSKLYQFGARYRRYSIADYVFNQAPGFFQMLLVDEVHQYKGKSSDRGIAFARLVDSVKWKLGLTGTVYGGKASDIYWLLYRLGAKNIQRAFDYQTARKWVELYGVMEERVQQGNGSSDSTDEYGSFNATRRKKVVREKPGVSPGILKYLIDNTLFLALKDLGVGLPPYQEEMVTVEMSGEQEKQYAKMFDHLKAIAREDSRYLSTWLQWSLGRPNTGFRDEQIIKLHRDEDGAVEKRELLEDLPSIVGEGELLPKEKWLVDYARSEVQAKRKVLVYARQTGKRDIQPRLKEALEDAGLRVKVLTTRIDTRKREAWVEKHAPATDVLIVNPRLVETGLDLVQFATIVFYEISYSLFTCWQAMRRVWRLGQEKPVKVIFVAYENTLETDALALMGKKMQAAQLLYGDEVGGAIVPEEDGDFLTQLARSVLEGKKLPDLQTIFTEAQQTTTSPLGSPTATSPRIVIRFSDLQELWKWERKNNDGRRRREKAPDVQKSFFSLLTS
jgi:superfamily II DNA or RNA helicase